MTLRKLLIEARKDLPKMSKRDQTNALRRLNRLIDNWAVGMHDIIGAYRVGDTIRVYDGKHEWPGPLLLPTVSVTITPEMVKAAKPRPRRKAK